MALPHPAVALLTPPAVIALLLLQASFPDTEASVEVESGGGGSRTAAAFLVPRNCGTEESVRTPSLLAKIRTRRPPLPPPRRSCRVPLSPPFVLAASESDDDSGGEDTIGDDGEGSKKKDGRAWMREAMGDVLGSASGDEAVTFPNTPLPPRPLHETLRDGLAGFAVEPSRGFGAMLVESSDGDAASAGGDDGRRRAVFVVVSPRDKLEILSAEALTLIQLAGGIDVATAIFPPDALRRAATEDDDKEDDERDDEGRREDVSRVALVGVEALYDPSSVASNRRWGGTDDDELPPSSPDRESKLASDAPRLHAASRNLPGLAGVTENDVLAALRIHADDDGNLDREAFSELLGSLRRSLAGDADDSGVTFGITLAVVRGKDASTRTVSAPPFLALALSIRHAVPVSVSKMCADAIGFMVEDIEDRYPSFRGIEELEEDAKAVDGFVPDMFFKYQPPQAE